MSQNYNQLTSRTERRQWKKTENGFNMEYPDTEASMNEIQRRYEEYLFNLHLNNQIVKLSSKKDKKEEELDKLEGGFSLYTNGAHKKNEKFTPRHTTAKSSSTDKKNFNFRPRLHMQKYPIPNLTDLEIQMDKERSCSAPNVVTRKKWENSNPSFTIKTADGCEIKINAPNNYKAPISKSDITSNNKKKHFFSKKNGTQSNNCESYYSDDFESESDNEFENQKAEENNFKKKLIESVQFSDLDTETDTDTDTNTDEAKDEIKNMNLLPISSSRRKMVLRLSDNDVKFLRESINELNMSIINESMLKSKIIDENSDLELDCDDLATNTKVKISNDSENKKLIFNKNENFKITIEDPGKRNDVSPVCDMLIQQITHLKQEEKEKLINFLSKC